MRWYRSVSVDQSQKSKSPAATRALGRFNRPPPRGRGGVAYETFALARQSTGKAERKTYKSY